MPNGLTQSQRRTLFATVREAAREQGEQPETYRKRVMAEELGVESLSQVGRGGDFDKLMSRVYQDCGDYGRALEYAKGSFSRLKHLIVRTAERIVAAKSDWRGSVYDYIAGVMRQSGMIPACAPRSWGERLVSDSGWLDFTEPQMRRLLMMLSTHLRRHG